MLLFGGGLKDTAAGKRAAICGCGDSDQFKLGDCDLGAGAGLGVAAVIIALITALIGFCVKLEDGPQLA